MKRLILWGAFVLALSAAVPSANAQISMYTTVLITPSVVYGWGVTNMENGADWLYYSAAADVYLFEDSTIIDTTLADPGDGNDVEGDVSAGVATGHSYWIWTNHWLQPYYYDDPFGYCDEDGYSTLSPADFVPDGTVYGPDTVTYTSSGNIFVGSSTDATNSYAPTISGIDQTSYGTAQADTSGYVIVYGNYLATMAGATTIAIDGVTVSISWDDWTYPVQLNGYYSIPYSTSAGSHTLTITTPFGSATSTFYSYNPPAPFISGISPDTIMVAGSEVAITISGQYFGNIICPTVHLPFAVYQDGASSSCSDNSMTLTVYAESTAEISSMLNPITVSTVGGTSNSFSFSVNGPFNMTVSSEQTGENAYGPDRLTVYDVFNLDGTQSDSYYVGEIFSWGWSAPGCSGTFTFSTSSCGATGLNYISVFPGSSSFPDTWSQLNASDISPVSCGINITDYWNACIGLTTHEIGLLEGNSYTGYTTIWGYQMSYPSDAGGMPSGTAIPR